MAWAGTRTWVGGELISAEILNQYFRDNLNSLHEAADDRVDYSWDSAEGGPNTNVTAGPGAFTTYSLVTLYPNSFVELSWSVKLDYGHNSGGGNDYMRLTASVVTPVVAYPLRFVDAWGSWPTPTVDPMASLKARWWIPQPSGVVLELGAQTITGEPHVMTVNYNERNAVNLHVWARRD